MLRTLRKWMNRAFMYVEPPNNAGEHFMKRKTLVLQCHPLSDSFSAAMSAAVITGLNSGGHIVRKRNLYTYEGQECYQPDSPVLSPALTAQEREEYYSAQAIDMRQALKLSGMSSEVGEAIVDLKWCDSIVFVFPIWWFNFPAALKGYFDRVLLPGVAFLLPNSSAAASTGVIGKTGLVGLLPHINKIGVVTSSGASWAVNVYAGRGPSHFISRGLRALCAPDCQLTWHQLYSIGASSDAERKEFLTKVEVAYRKF